MENGIKFYLRVGGVLFLVCAITALLLSAVNALTKDKIEDNMLQKMNSTIAEIFEGNIKTEMLEIESIDPVKEIYSVYIDENIVGYAVHVAPVGFKGEIDMMVGVDLEGNCTDVKIISMSETPGLGSKVGEDSFLSQYKNGGGAFVVKENITPVAGATVSSTAVTSGVNAAIEALMTGGMIK